VVCSTLQPAPSSPLDRRLQRACVCSLQRACVCSLQRACIGRLQRVCVGEVD
jgi:hypothetical protein